MRAWLGGLICMALLATAPSVASANCTGPNLIAALPEPDRARLREATDSSPFATGNLWRATKDGRVMTILGTYHLGDPRHDAIVARVAPLVEASGLLLVEAGPEEESALLSEIGRDPSIMLITEGPSLLEQMEKDDWEKLAQAMRARSIPPFMAAKFKPWYVSLMLGIPPCAMEAIAGKDGLDQRIMDVAAARGLPIRALERYDTILTLFERMPAEDQIAMIQATLIMEDEAPALNVTLADAYFAEDGRLIWEFMRELSRTMPGVEPAQADAEFNTMEEVLINARNRAWIPVLEDAVAEGPVFAAFGALHLSGDQGVLRLLERAGWTLERLPLE